MIRSQAEVILISRCGAALVAVSKDGTTVNGSNEDLNGPLWYALDRLGYSVANISLVSDTDIQAVADEDILPFLAIAEIQILENVLNSAFTFVDITIGPRRESLSQFAESLEKTISRKKEDLTRDFGDLWGRGLEFGIISVESVEDGDNIY